jgi:hypothetical protein
VTITNEDGAGAKRKRRPRASVARGGEGYDRRWIKLRARKPAHPLPPTEGITQQGPSGSAMAETAARGWQRVMGAALLAAPSVTR